MPSSSTRFPPADLRQAIVESVPYLLSGWREDARNALLTLARMWLTAATGRIEPKGRAAEWAMARLPPESAAWLARARADYLGLAEQDWTAAEDLAPVIARLASEVEASLGPLTRPRA